MKSIELRGKTIKYANNDHFFVAAELGKWEPETFDILDKFIVPGWTFLDVGCWCGLLSIYAHKLGAKVFAVEPDEVAFSQFIENTEVNEHREGIEISKLAISDKDGSAPLYSNAYFGNSESSLMLRELTTGTKTVETKTLITFVKDNNILPNKICLLKIDAEGSEQLIIEGNRDFFDQYRPKIVIAFHPAWLNLHKTIEAVKNNIFPFYNVFPISMKQQYTEIDFKNALFTNHDHSFVFIPKP